MTGILHKERDFREIVKSRWQDGTLKKGKDFYNHDLKVKYHCANANINAVDADKTWEIWKFTYSDTILDRWEGPRIGAITDEATVNALSWNI